MGKYFKAYLIFLAFFILVTISKVFQGGGGYIILPLIIAPIVLTIIWGIYISVWDYFFNKKIGKNGFTQLMNLSANGEINAIQNQFNSNSVDLNTQDNGGYTALMYASSSGHLNVVELLLSMGVDKELVTKNGNNALFFAENKKFDEIASILKSKN